MNLEKFKYTFLGFLIAIACTAIGATAATKLYESNEVGYDNSTSGISATDVQGAIDELYAAATDYSSMQTTVNAFDERITTNANGISTLNTRYNTLNSSITSLQSTLNTLNTNINNLQTSFNNANAYSKTEIATDYGITVIAEKRNGVVQVTLRGTTSQQLATGGAMVTLATLPEAYRPNGVEGNNSKIFYVPVHQHWRMQYYVTPAGLVRVGYTIKQNAAGTTADPYSQNYPTNYTMYSSITYVTNR